MNIERSGRDLILHQATRLFINQGFNGVSMREIAESCNMTKAALYYHFKDKADLLRAIFTTYLETTRAHFSLAMKQSGNPRDRISNLVKEFLLLSPEERGVIYLMIIEGQFLETELRDEITHVYHDQLLENLTSLIQEGIRQEELKDKDPYLTANLLLSMMYPFFHSQEKYSEEKLDQKINIMLEIFFEGMAKRGEQTG